MTTKTTIITENGVIHHFDSKAQANRWEAEWRKVKAGNKKAIDTLKRQSPRKDTK
jgi:hypothetical protein